VSLFAQELGTAEPVSTVRLARMLPEAASSTPASPPGRAAALPVREKGAPLKSLGALDQLFRK
jgi:ATP-dependent helicase HrpA